MVRRDRAAARAALGAVFLADGCGLGLSDAELAVVLLAMAAGAVLAAPVAGRLAARLGGRRCTVAAGVAFALLLALPPAMPSRPLLAAAAFALGAANGALDVVASAQAAAVERVLGRPVMSSLHGLLSLGALAGVGLAGLLPAAGGAFPSGLAGAALAGLVALAGRHLPGGGGTVVTDHARGRRSGPVAILGGLALLSVLAEWAMLDWSAVYLVDVLRAAPGLAALGLAALAAATALGRLAGDGLVRRLGARRVLALSGALLAAGVLATVAAGDVPTALAGLALAGLGLANPLPLLVSSAARLPGLAPGVGVAAVTALAYAGDLLGPAAVGLGAGLVGLRAALAGLALVGVALGAAAAAGAVGRGPVTGREWSAGLAVPAG